MTRRGVKTIPDAAVAELPAWQDQMAARFLRAIDTRIAESRGDPAQQDQVKVLLKLKETYLHKTSATVH